MMENKDFTNKVKDLVIKYLTNEISENELIVLHNWLNEKEENKSLFNKLRNAWLVSGKMPVKEHIEVLAIRDSLWKKIRSRQQETSGFTISLRRNVKYIAIAASWLIFLFLGSILPLHEKYAEKISVESGDSKTEIMAPLGAKCRIILPDNSEVWLNAGSRIVYDKTFNYRERMIHLEGEAYFSVAENKDCPFKVTTSEIMITALGTKFNVKAYPEEETITATLEEGKIDIKLINGKRNNEEIVLKPNENIVYYRVDSRLKLDNLDKLQSGTYHVAQKAQSVPKIKIIPVINTELYTSWKEDRWIFLGEPLPLLASKLERRFNLRIVFAEELLKSYKFSGAIENETIEQILQALRFTAPLKYRFEKDTIILSVDDQLVKKYKKIIKPKD